MKRYIISLIIFVGSICILSCDKYLDVKPKDQFLEEDIYAHANTIHGALNGIYLKLGESSLYGSNMSMTKLDILAQYYRNNKTTNQIAKYLYNDSDVQKSFDAMWSGSYASIMNINSFMKGLRGSSVELGEGQKDILLGESYGLRAYLHFDMLRLFGPLYKSNSSAESIPYLREATAQIQPLKTAKEIGVEILADIDSCITLLENDPVKKNGPDYALGNLTAENQFKLRNRRMNYYAAKSLKARVLLYVGNTSEAFKVATSLIADSKTWFNWSPAALSMPGIQNPDRVFSSEVLFGLDNYGMYDVYLKNFDPSIIDNEILAPPMARLNAIYENNESDYRYRVNWISGASGGKEYRVFGKYKDIIDKTAFFRKYQPMLRISELYLIAAECAETEDVALKYLNSLRENRGLAVIRSFGNKSEELMKEYRKEFWGEGQMFYFFKRTERETIQSGHDGSIIKMGTEKYQVPLPLSEISIRKSK